MRGDRDHRQAEDHDRARERAQHSPAAPLGHGPATEVHERDQTHGDNIDQSILEMIAAHGCHKQALHDRRRREQGRERGGATPTEVPDPHEERDDPEIRGIFDGKRGQVSRSDPPPPAAGGLGVVRVGQELMVIEQAKREVRHDDRHEAHGP